MDLILKDKKIFLIKLIIFIESMIKFSSKRNFCMYFEKNFHIFREKFLYFAKKKIILSRNKYLSRMFRVNHNIKIMENEKYYNTPLNINILFLKMNNSL